MGSQVCLPLSAAYSLEAARLLVVFVRPGRAALARTYGVSCRAIPHAAEGLGVEVFIACSLAHPARRAATFFFFFFSTISPKYDEPGDAEAIVLRGAPRNSCDSFWLYFTGKGWFTAPERGARGWTALLYEVDSVEAPGDATGTESCSRDQ